MENKKDTVIAKISFSKGILNGRSIVLAQTGIGKVNAAIATTIMIEHFKPSEIVFSGIAGGINPALFPGDIVIGTKVTYHDYGAIEDGGMLYRPTKNPYTMQENPVTFNCDSALIQKALSVAPKLKFSKVKRDNGSFTPTITKGNYRYRRRLCFIGNGYAKIKKRSGCGGDRNGRCCCCTNLLSARCTIFDHTQSER